MSRLVGIDLGSTAVRVAEVAGRGRDGMALVQKAAIEPLASGAIIGGRIEDPVAVSVALRKALRVAHVSPYGAVVGLASPDVGIAYRAVPAALSPREWPNAIRLAGKPIVVRIPLADSALSLRQVDGGPNLAADKVQLLAAVAHRSQIEQVAHVCKLARISARAIDLAGAAALRAVTLGADNQTVAVVDVGASKTMVSVRSGAHLRSVQVIEEGGDLITTALMNSLSVSFGDAERYKKGARAGVGAANWDASASAAIDQLADVIGQTLESGTLSGPPLGGLVLIGRGALLRGFKEQVSQRVGVPVVLGRAAATVVPTKYTSFLLSAGAEGAEAMLSLTTAIGLARWTGAL